MIVTSKVNKKMKRFTIHKIIVEPSCYQLWKTNKIKITLKLTSDVNAYFRSKQSGKIRRQKYSCVQILTTKYLKWMKTHAVIWVIAMLFVRKLIYHPPLRKNIKSNFQYVHFQYVLPFIILLMYIFYVTYISETSFCSNFSLICNLR